MREIQISEFEEMEYNLKELGLEGFILGIEENRRYIAGNEFFIEIPESGIDSLLIFKEGEILIIDEEKDVMKLNSEQLEEIKNILNS